MNTGSQDYAIGLTPGISASDYLTGPAFSVLNAPSGSTEGIAATPTATFNAPKGSPLFWLVGLLGLVIVVHLIHRVERRKAGKEVGGLIDDAVGINLWNFITTGLMASLFILTLKVGANKWFAGSTFASVATAI